MYSKVHNSIKLLFESSKCQSMQDAYSTIAVRQLTNAVDCSDISLQNTLQML